MAKPAKGSVERSSVEWLAEVWRSRTEKSQMGYASFFCPPPLATPPSVAWRGPSPAPPYSPELQPAETLWALVDEPIVNKHIATIEELEEKIANQCVALAEQPDRIQKRAGFHWWPRPIVPH